MDMELVFSRHPVNLGDGFILFQDFRHPSKGIRLGFKLEIAGYRTADFLGATSKNYFLRFWARDFVLTKVLKIPEYFVYCGIFKTHCEGKRSVQNPKG